MRKTKRNCGFPIQQHLVYGKQISEIRNALLHFQVEYYNHYTGEDRKKGTDHLAKAVAALDQFKCDMDSLLFTEFPNRDERESKFLMYLYYPNWTPSGDWERPMSLSEDGLHSMLESLGAKNPKPKDKYDILREKWMAREKSKPQQWDHAMACRKLDENNHLQGICRYVPEISSFIERLKRIDGTDPEYNRIRTWYDLKHEFQKYVGWEAKDVRFRKTSDWDALRDAVNEYLPPDTADLAM